MTFVNAIWLLILTGILIIMLIERKGQTVGKTINDLRDSFTAQSTAVNDLSVAAPAAKKRAEAALHADIDYNEFADAADTNTAAIKTAVNILNGIAPTTTSTNTNTNTNTTATETITSGDVATVTAPPAADATAATADSVPADLNQPA